MLVSGGFHINNSDRDSVASGEREQSSILSLTAATQHINFLVKQIGSIYQLGLLLKI